MRPLRSVLLTISSSLLNGISRCVGTTRCVMLAPADYVCRQLSTGLACHGHAIDMLDQDQQKPGHAAIQAATTGYTASPHRVSGCSSISVISTGISLPSRRTQSRTCLRLTWLFQVAPPCTSWLRKV